MRRRFVLGSRRRRRSAGRRSAAIPAALLPSLRAETGAHVGSSSGGADIFAIWEARKDISLQELRQALIGVGLHVSVAGLYRFFVRRGMTRKKRLATPSSRTAPTS